MLYVSLGVQSSASTWVYNVIKSILKKRGIAYDAYMSETMGDVKKHFAKRARTHVWKAHNLEMPLLRMIELTAAPLIISVRDPRDAAASLVTRFGANPVEAVQQITRSIASVFSAVASVPKALVFEYELGFPERAETVRQIADLMNIALTPEELDEIRAEFSIEKVREFTAKLDALPSDRLLKRGQDTMDTESHFHRTHVSDAAIGKWKKVYAEGMHADLDTLFEPMVGIAFYEPGMAITFRPGLFRGDLAASTAKRPHFRHGGYCLLDQVFLGQGRWSFSLSIAGNGGMKAAKGVRVVHEATEYVNRPIQSGRNDALLSFEGVCSQHHLPIEVFLLFDQPPQFAKGQIPRATLTATFIGPL
jgi:Sulfotransferase domain